jgi:hypothetical protein
MIHDWNVVFFAMIVLRHIAIEIWRVVESLREFHNMLSFYISKIPSFV